MPPRGDVKKPKPKTGGTSPGKPKVQKGGSSKDAGGKGGDSPANKKKPPSLKKAGSAGGTKKKPPPSPANRNAPPKKGPAPAGSAKGAKYQGGGPPKRKKEKHESKGKQGYWTMMYKKWIHSDGVVLKEQASKEAVEALGLTQKHLKRLKIKFEEIDLDQSGSIDSEEFFEVLEEARSPFTDALFALIDLDGSGTIEFEEFIRVCVTYCMYTKEDILRFCFETFDKDGSGTIDEKEFIELCRIVNNASPMFPGNFAEAVAQFDTNDDGLIDFNEFIELDRRYPLVLFPAFRLQDRMQRVTLGQYAWVDIHKSIQKTKHIQEYMDAHGGQRPPPPLMKKICRAICPCLTSKERIIVMDTLKNAQDKDRKAAHKNKTKN